MIGVISLLCYQYNIVKLKKYIYIYNPKIHFKYYGILLVSGYYGLNACVPLKFVC